MPLQQVIGLCCILSVRDYLKLRPEGILDKDVYVCESRYATKPRSFKKIKVKKISSLKQDIIWGEMYKQNFLKLKFLSFFVSQMWPFSLPEHIPLIPREEPLEPKRVMSVFRERVEKHKEEIAELEEGEKLTEKEAPVSRLSLCVYCCSANVQLPLSCFQQNVEMFNPHGIEGTMYYEQYRVPSCGSIKTGDCVYVRTSTGRQCVTQVDSLWITKE